MNLKYCHIDISLLNRSCIKFGLFEIANVSNRYVNIVLIWSYLLHTSKVPNSCTFPCTICREMNKMIRQLYINHPVEKNTCV